MTITIKDVAQRAEVSIQTVSIVLNRRVNVRPKTRSRVLKACEELNYTPNAVARSLVTRKSKTIGVIVTNIRNPIYGDIIATINEVAEAGRTRMKSWSRDCSLSKIIIQTK
jgi:LacI family transcriptional regulator